MPKVKEKNIIIIIIIITDEANFQVVNTSLTALGSISNGKL